MPLVIGTHDVEDVQKWLSSPLRQQVFEANGIKCTPFTDPQGSNSTALLFDVPDMEAFQKLMESDGSKAAAKSDGVIYETLRVFVER
ncbi:hypothetical protein QWJ17_12285 [Betaproteobacteria bacterium LSUCC0117]|nr:hypothetical protein [Betaproteobacteria bacterium LSUCC0117]